MGGSHCFSETTLGLHFGTRRRVIVKPKLPINATVRAAQSLLINEDEFVLLN